MSAQQCQDEVCVLHLIGSPTSEFYFDLSLMYGRTAVEFEGLDRDAFKHNFAVVSTDGQWAFPSALDAASLQAAERMHMPAALEWIEAREPKVDVVMPHMFCMEGMTRYRALMEMLGLEVLGCPAHTCTIANDKFLTKQLCKSAGVPVPEGELFRADMLTADIDTTARQILARRATPLIVKPAREDNSIGLSLVKTSAPEELAAALTKAFKYDNHILVEEYIAGRECRVAVLEIEEESGSTRLEVLPKIEYLLDDIRTAQHKLSTDDQGKLLTSDSNPADAIVKAKTAGDRVCPAEFSPEVHQRLDDLARRAHKALGCKYYSLYDVRINEEGYPFMLEAALFCSFSPYSVVVALADKTGDEQLQPHPKVFQMLLRRAAAATRSRREGGGAEEASTGGAIKGALKGTSKVAPTTSTTSELPQVAVGA